MEGLEDEKRRKDHASLLCNFILAHMCMKKEEGGKNRKNKGSEIIPEKASNEVVPNKRKIEGVVPAERKVFWYLLFPFHSYG